MHFPTLLLTLTSLAGLAVALPKPVPQGYTGPCSDTDCGGIGNKCRRGYMCVPFPTTIPAEREGCTCSYG